MRKEGSPLLASHTPEVLTVLFSSMDVSPASLRCLLRVRHLRQSRWLDECDRLKGGCPTESL
ncbi:MAG: hypothetical protein AAFV90_29660, partial [Cyanobacteria bacterium J06634_5]